MALVVGDRGVGQIDIEHGAAIQVQQLHHAPNKTRVLCLAIWFLNVGAPLFATAARTAQAVTIKAPDKLVARLKACS